MFKGQIHRFVLPMDKRVLFLYLLLLLPSSPKIYENSTKVKMIRHDNKTCWQTEMESERDGEREKKSPYYQTMVKHNTS